jgi:hypothetical protein
LDNEKNYIQYIILAESNGRSYIDKYYDGIKYHFDITDKVDDFYYEIKDLGLEKWNMNTYGSSIHWTPPADCWTLEIQIEDISVVCKGQDAVPKNWDKFWKAFDRMCNSE